MKHGWKSQLGCCEKRGIWVEETVSSAEAKPWLWQLEHTAWEPVSHVAFLWQGTRGEKINDKGQICTEQPVLVADVMPENNLSTEDTYTACIPTKAQILRDKWVTHLIQPFCRKPTKEETVGTELTLLESRTNLSVEASTQAIKLAEH